MIFLKLIFIGIKVLYNVLLVSAVQQSESAIHTHTHTHTHTYLLSFRFPSHLGHDRELSRVPCII